MKITGYNSCQNLIDTVNTNWKFKKRKDYYKSKFTPANIESKEVNLPCIRGVKKEDIKILFGKPNYISDNFWKYYTSPEFKNGFVNSYLAISFEYDRVKNVTETNCKGTLKYIRKNWKPIKRGNHFKTTFIPGKQGVEKVTIPCVKKLDRTVFKNIFGKPNLAFEGTFMLGMKGVEWDDKGKEIKQKPRNNKKIIYRYITSNNKEIKYENSILEVTFIPPEKVYQIESYNCNNTINMFKANWIYIDSLGYYNQKFSNRNIKLFSRCFYGMDSITVMETFGIPSEIKNGNEWHYKVFKGEGIKLLFYNDILLTIERIYSIVPIRPH